METAKLKKFAQFARRSLVEQVSAKLKLVLAGESPARREQPEAVKKLEEAIKGLGKEQVIERVAYIWFNRFCALRFMDVNRYNRVNIVSPADPGQFQPEILGEAKMGHIDDEMVHDKVRQQIVALLDSKAPSRDPQGEAYRLLVVAACNFWNEAMPFLFQRINDYTELLMPDDLLSGNSILAYTREAMTPDACEDVEVIGWLYQFYVSEKKDEVFNGLKKNKKITPENIPAATQLFTPHWIVRYLVDNSLGRLWLLNRPTSRIFERMKERGEDCYYIKPEQAETDFLHIAKPEEIKICDPACGSGHMLTYAFDLLYAIYEEEGYEPAEIPEKILTHNLYGIEIDERAGELAAFALTMKARAKQRRFLNKGVKPNICVLENIHFDEGELKNYMDFVGRDLFTAPLQTTLRQFEEADNFGSLIRPNVTDVDSLFRTLDSKNVSGHLFLSPTHQKVLRALRQADYLSPKYHIVIANPPYMGGKGMNGRLSTWAKDNYPESKADLFSMFMVRAIDFCRKSGYMGMINLPSWLFLSSFERLRLYILNNYAIDSLLHMGRGIFGIDWGTVAFIVKKAHEPFKIGAFFRLHKRNFQHIYCHDIEKLFLNAKNNHAYRFDFDQYRDDGGVNEITKTSFISGQKLYYHSTVSDFKMIPGTPIVYWATRKVMDLFSKNFPLSRRIETREGLTTGSNELFLRLWHEISLANIGFCMRNNQSSVDSKKKWFTYVKGGDFRRWSGNFEFVVNWLNDGEELRIFKDPETGRVRSHNYNGEYAFQTGFTWSGISSGTFAVRHVPAGYMFDAKGPMGFSLDPSEQRLHEGFLNSAVTNHLIRMLAPTLDFKLGHILNLPVLITASNEIREICKSAVLLSTNDWNAFETSWDFTILPLLNPDYRQSTLKGTYQKLRAHWWKMTLETQHLEEENNRIFINAYGLQNELKSEVSLNEITLTCNPHYRYGNDKSDKELEALLMADTMRELVSYAVGCMFGRYALDKPGLMLANQGETFEDYLKQVPEPCFPADDDNVIPMLDGDWFTDDIAERFRKFLRVAFGEDYYEENIRFVEQALNIKGKRNYSIRDYFLGEFYTDHVKRYKKRPIYWMFSSPKGSFNALIYMHRYRPDTVSVVLNDYLREFRTKLTSHKNHLEAVSISASSSQAEKTKALKEIEKITKMIVEMEEYEREVLYPLATEQVEIDLDDGVKVNYPKLGAALKKIVGLDASNE